QFTTKAREVMSGKTDQIKGRAKEAAGAITDDDRLRREGKRDQTAGKVKEKVENAVDKVKDAVSDADKPAKD
ncbi:MAG TPA: CsbD family protein, partial [Pirellulales bacterium]|nr:CsbD family protein [Pirellulales bacterium]